MRVTEAELRMMLQRQVNALIVKAESFGYVVTIESVPDRPLAMGNHHMVGSVRPKRIKADK